MEIFKNWDYASAIENVMAENNGELERVVHALGVSGVYLIGGAVRDSIVNVLYGKEIPITDYDFFSERHTKTDLERIFSGWENVSFSRLGSPKIKFDDFEVDVVPYDNTIAESKYGMKPTIENVLRCADITTSSVGYSLENFDLYSYMGHEAILKRQVEIMCSNSLIHDISRLILHSEKLGFSLGEGAMKLISENYNSKMDFAIGSYLNYKGKDDKVDKVLTKLKEIKLNKK